MSVINSHFYNILFNNSIDHVHHNLRRIGVLQLKFHCQLILYYYLFIIITYLVINKINYFNNCVTDKKYLRDTI